MQLKPCTILHNGSYRIISTLGRGGFGVTYLAEQVMAKRKVCIKEFFPKDYYKRDDDTGSLTLTSDGFGETMNKFKTKFIKEAQTIAALDHPNIIHIHDVFEENGTAYYVMDYIEGESLSEFVKRNGAMSERDAVGYIKQVASALEHIHEQQIMHLDVKPGNIMVRSKDNNAILIDFGLSKHYDAKSGEATSTTPVGVSHGYAPMEQYQDGGVSTFSPETDIYSLGATLYFLVTGNIPPRAADLEMRDLPTLPKHLSYGIRKAIADSVQYLRKDRPHSIAKFIELLDTKADTGVTVTVNIDSDDTKFEKPETPPYIKLQRKNRWRLWLLLPLIIIVGIFFILGNGEDRETNPISTSDTKALEANSVANDVINIPDNEIWYTSIDDTSIEIKETDITGNLVFGTQILSNEVIDGKGVIKCKGNISMIGNSAFADCHSLTSITLPKNVTRIGYRAFLGCSNLTNIVIPNKVTSIGDAAFIGCNKLMSITIPNNVEEIGSQAFAACSSLTSVNIPSNVSNIEEDAFYDCPSIKHFMGKYATDDKRCLIKDNTIFAYAHASGTVYTIPNDVKTIGSAAFSQCNTLSEITIPDSVTNIECGAFDGCESLHSIDIQAKITELSEDLFCGCLKLSSITIPDSVTAIGDGAFYNCTNLENITIPNSVEYIGEDAFYGCHKLSSITIPANVRTIGKGAFNECRKLKDVYCEATNPPAGSKDMFLNNAPGRKIHVPTNSCNEYKEADYWRWYNTEDVFQTYADTYYSVEVEDTYSSTIHQHRDS